MLTNFISSLLGQGIEKLGNQAVSRWFRTSYYVLALAFALYGLVASLWLWQSPAYPHVSGLLQFAAGRDVGWTLLTPVCLGITALILIIPVAGRFSLALMGAVASVVVGMFSLITLQGRASGISDGLTTLSMLSLFALLLLTLLLSINDHPSLTSPLAHLAVSYVGRLSQMQTLQRFGQERHLQIQGPTGRENALTIEGPFDAAHYQILTSNRKVELQKSSTSMLTIALTSPYDIPGFYCGKKQLSADERTSLQEIPTAIQGRPRFYSYLRPYPQRPLTPAIQQQLIDHINRRRGILPDDAIVQATPLGMRIRLSRTYRRMTAKDGNPEAQLHWLRGLIAILEPISMPLTQEEIAVRWRKYKK